MPKNYYVDRDKESNIIALYSRPQKKDHEKLDESDEGIQEFKNNQNDIAEKNKLIRAKEKENSRTKAIADLKTEGKLPADYSETAAVI